MCPSDGTLNGAPCQEFFLVKKIRLERIGRETKYFKTGHIYKFWPLLNGWYIANPALNTNQSINQSFHHCLRSFNFFYDLKVSEANCWITCLSTILRGQTFVSSFIYLYTEVIDTSKNCTPRHYTQISEGGEFYCFSFFLIGIL